MLLLRFINEYLKKKAYHLAIAICCMSSYGSGIHSDPSILLAGDDITPITNPGPTFTGSDASSSAAPNGGHGILVTGTIGGINSITGPLNFIGGAGYIKFASFEDEAAHGGSGLYLDNVNLNVTNASFQGGFGGVNITSSGNVFGESGYGVEWSVDSGNSSSLNFAESSISNGLKIATGNESILELSYTNTTILGGINKYGLGDLYINNYDEGSLFGLTNYNGKIVFSDDIDLQSEELIRLGGSGASLVASNGLSIAGQISGVSGSLVEVYSGMSISGTLAGSFDVELASATNSIILLDGYDIGSVVFKGSNGVDTLVIEKSGTYGADDLGMGSSFQAFEGVQLSENDDIWEISASEITSGELDYFLFGGDGTNDTIAVSSSGSYSSDDFLPMTNYISGFELFGLSDEIDIWIAKINDHQLGGIIDARGGEDVISFEEYEVSLNEIDTLYQNFEGAQLESSGGVWQATNDFSRLDFIDANNYGWTLSFSASNATEFSAQDIGSTEYFRNFTNIELTDNNDIWNVTDNDIALKTSGFIDGGTGTNTLKGSIPNSDDIGLSYINFNQVELTGGSDLWEATTGDTNLNFVNALLGADTLIYSSLNEITNSLAMGDNLFYQNFESVDLGAGSDEWRASTNDFSLSVSGGSGSDLLSYNDYEQLITSFSKATHIDNLYTSFSSIELSTNDNIWTYSSGDSTLSSIDGSHGVDILSIEESIDWTTSHKNRYADFEILRLDNQSILTFSDNDLGSDVLALAIQGNSTVDLEDNSLSGLTIYTQEGGSILSMNAQGSLITSARLTSDQITFSPGAIIQFNHNDPSSFAIGNRYTNYVSQATTPSGLDISNIDSLFSDNPGALDVKDWYIIEDSLFAIFDRRSLTNQAYGIETVKGSQLESILTEIDSLATDEASQMIDSIFAGASTAADLNKVYNRTVALPRAVSHLRNGVLRTIGERAGERRMMLGSSLRPQGPEGPIRPNTKTSFWIKGYSANGDSSADNILEGYDLSGVGTVLGFDYTSEQWVIGLAGGIFSQTMKMDISGEYSGSGNHITGYASYGSDGWFFESSLSLASSSLEFKSDGSLDLKTDYVGTDSTVYLGTGYILRNNDSSWVPEIGFVFNTYSQDKAKDVSNNIVPVELDDFTKSSMQMRLGLTGIFQRELVGRELLTQVKARWINTLGVMDEEAEFKLSGGTDTYDMPLLSSAKSVVELGFGAQLKMNRSFALIMGFDYEIGGGYTANRLSAGLRYSF